MKAQTNLKSLFLTLLILTTAISNAQYFSSVNPTARTLDKTNAKVGTLPGAINVNSIGAATYEIPVFVSPGTAGMQPKISIIYNSMVADGLLGIGWDIAGLSEIRRVSQNFYNDNNVSGIILQNTDRFALDSNRLVLTSQHQYGDDNSEYATEIETFSRITAHGTAGTGPGWFEVKAKNGNILEYGNTSDSRVEAHGSATVYMWRVNKITDPNGNSMNFIYYEINGESYISRIDYTINAQAGLAAPYNSLIFNYYSSPRSDINTHFVAGSQIPKTKLLSSIRMETEGGVLVREYQFKYVNDVYSHLNQITEFGSNGTYLNATVIGWGAETTDFLHNTNVFNDGKKDKFYYGDFNGDGRTDFVVTERKSSFTSSDKWKLYFANTQGTGFAYISEGSLDAAFKGFIVADVNGNGKEDILWRTRENISYPCNPHPCDVPGLTVSKSNQAVVKPVIPTAQDTCWDYCTSQQEVFRYYYYSGTGMVRGSSSYDLVFQNAPADISLLPVELDGDGKVDYIALFSNRDIYDIRGISNYGFPSFNTPDAVRVIDFNGNGKKDLLVIKDNSSFVYEFNSLSNRFSAIYSSLSYPTSSDRLLLGDYNGDKNTDFLSWKDEEGWSLKLSTGTSLVISSVPSLINIDPDSYSADNNYYTGDFNGDRKDDIVEIYKQSANSVIKVFYSRGGGNFDYETKTYTLANINQDLFNPGDFNGDGRKDLFYYDYSIASNYVNIFFFHKDEIKHLVKNIANGFNFQTTIIYQRLNSDTDTAYYRSRNTAILPVTDYKGPLYTVASVVAGDSSFTNYFYDGAKIHRQGIGFLGFTKTTKLDVLNNFKSINSFEINGTCFFTALKKQEYKLGDATLISQVVNTNKVIPFENKRIFPYTDQVETLDNLQKIITITNTDYDNTGNLTHSTTSYRNNDLSVDAIKSITNTFGTYGNYGIANKITKTKVISTYTGQPSYSREIEYQYDAKGNLVTTISDPGKEKQVIKTSTLNSYGLVSRETVSASGLTSRITLYEFDPKFRFIAGITNSMGQSTSMQYSPGTGNQISFTNISKKITTMEYDGLGRLIKTINPLGNEITEDLSWDTKLDGGENSLFAKVTLNPGKSPTYEYFDLSGRVIRTGIIGYSGELAYTEMVYNRFGALSKKSNPHSFEEPPSVYNWTTYGYDDFGRVRFEASDFGFKWIKYDNKTKEIDNDGQKKYITINALGDVVSVKENNNGNLVITYVYHSNGQVKEINSAGNNVNTVYDEYGNPVSVTNPNSGTSNYTYNAFGEKTSSTDPKPNSLFSYYYDGLGRLDYFSSAEGTTDYKYDDSENGAGQIQSVTTSSGISQSYSYDAFGRVKEFRNTIPGEEDLTTSFGYDNYGNNTSINYPEGFGVKNVFINGYLKEIRKADNSLIWRVDYTNSLNQPMKYTLGPENLVTTFTYDTIGYLTKKVTKGREQSFSFDRYTGNLISRGFKSGNIDLTETFTYDPLDRLVTSSVNGGEAAYLTYADNGNILTKSGTGNYAYLDDRINAVKEITNNSGSISNETQNLSYTSFNKVSGISEGINNLEVTYGPDQQRTKTVLKENGVPLKTKYYSLNYEKEITPSGTRHIYYISSPFGLVAVNIKEPGSEKLYFVETDHLGSITALINPDGTVDNDKKFSYDPWGRRRNPDNWSFNNVPQSFIIDRGFTGHEHYDRLSLIDMNGRVYDPVQGRFLSPDPFIQSPDFTQSFNGYSYCFNNPLKFSDPTGYNANNDIGEYIHTMCFGENSRIDEMWKELFVGNFYEVFYGSSPRVRSTNKEFQQISLKDLNGDEKPFLIPIIKEDGQQSMVINNYQGVAGLSIKKYYTNQSYPGQMVIDISYTSSKTAGGNWTQLVTLKSEYGTQSFYDNGNMGKGGSNFYYTDVEILEHTNGTSISFYDNPYFSRTISFSAELSLVTPSEGIILTLSWGFSYKSGSQNPNTIFPLNVKYNKF